MAQCCLLCVTYVIIREVQESCVMTKVTGDSEFVIEIVYICDSNYSTASDVDTLEGIYYCKQEAICFPMGNGKSYAILLKAVKIGWQIACNSPTFLPPTFFTVRYVYNVEHSVVNTCQQVFSFS